jgi:hypothetical protein
MEDEWNEEEEKTKEHVRRKLMIRQGPEYGVGREQQLQERFPVCYPPKDWLKILVTLYPLPPGHLLNSTFKADPVFRRIISPTSAFIIDSKR